MSEWIKHNFIYWYFFYNLLFCLRLFHPLSALITRSGHQKLINTSFVVKLPMTVSFGIIERILKDTRIHPVSWVIHQERSR